MCNNRHQVPNLVSEIYREVLRLSCAGNDIFFSFDSQFKTIGVRGYSGNAFCRNRKPIINRLANYDEPKALKELIKLLKETYKFERGSCYGPA